MPGGFSPPPGPSDAAAETESSNGSRVAALVRGVGVPALVATVVGLASLAGILPPGVAVRALRGAACFGDDGVVRAWWVLASWSIVPLLLIALLDAVRRRRPTSPAGG